MQSMFVPKTGKELTRHMPVIAVINRKGGSGKSTLATHLAAYLAHAGWSVMLGDADKQQSTQSWLKLRAAETLPSTCTPILGWAVDPKGGLRPPTGVTHVVLDTPGGLRDFDLARIAMHADAILMPVCNSVFDRESAAACFAELMNLPRIATGRCKIAAVGMRVDARTKAADTLKAWAGERKLAYLGSLRDTQTYVRCVERGLTLFDLPASQVQVDLLQWEPLLQWLAPVVERRKLPRAPTKPPSLKPVSETPFALKPVHKPIDVASRHPRMTPVAPRTTEDTAPPKPLSMGQRVGHLLGSLFHRH